jgi:hypothetical protein
VGGFVQILLYFETIATASLSDAVVVDSEALSALVSTAQTGISRSKEKKRRILLLMSSAVEKS